jgi:hypothetical protein
MKTWAIINAAGVAAFLTDGDSEPIWPDHTAVDVTGTFMGPGWTLTEGAWVAPVVPADPTQWLIDVGPFMDRFGGQKLDVLTSTNVVVQALVKDLMARHWIDLKRGDLSAGLDALRVYVPTVTAELKTAILTTPITAEENLALRKLYFGG